MYWELSIPLDGFSMCLRVYFVQVALLLNGVAFFGGGDGEGIKKSI